MRTRAMINTLAYLTTAVILTIFVATPAFAGPAAKFTANVSNLTLVTYDTAKPGEWETVLTTTIKTPSKKDLLIGASFETGLYTKTQVKGKHGEPDTAKASAGLYVRLLIDGEENYAYPHWVIYDKRFQELSATLGGVIESCTDPENDGVISVGDDCVVTDESIELMLETMAAHHYNFVVPNMASGTHTVAVQVMVKTDADSGKGSANAMAMVGRGSLTVEEVRATNSPEGIGGIEFPE